MRRVPPQDKPKTPDISTWRVTLWVSSAALLLSLLSASGPLSTAQSDPLIVAAGDIACDPLHEDFNRGAGREGICRAQATADLVARVNPTAVLPLGDTQYDDGDLLKFKDSYDRSWGRFKTISHPAVGNHEYVTRGAKGYFAYFGHLAGDPQKGYYSYDIGTWHLIALNSNCVFVGGCGEGSPQEQWLRADLAAHAGSCTLAYWHHPKFSSGLHGNHPFTRAFWQALYQAGADIVLAGHDHSYERFAPQDPDGVADPAHGIREFVVGTGGRSYYFFRTVQPNSEVRKAEAYGILVLTLHPREYEWQFLPEPGKDFTDGGRASCH